jgi:hypothetical protein
MHAKQGDQIVIDTTTLDALRRYGEVIGQGEREHYRIRWHDGHESVYFPGPDARVVSTAEQEFDPLPGVTRGPARCAHHDTTPTCRQERRRRGTSSPRIVDQIEYESWG